MSYTILLFEYWVRFLRVPIQIQVSLLTCLVLTSLSLSLVFLFLFWLLLPLCVSEGLVFHLGKSWEGSLSLLSSSSSPLPRTFWFWPWLMFLSARTLSQLPSIVPHRPSWLTQDFRIYWLCSAMASFDFTDTIFIGLAFLPVYSAWWGCLETATMLSPFIVLAAAFCSSCQPG